MSSLTDIEKRYLEKLLDMGRGYVLPGSQGGLGKHSGGTLVSCVSMCGAIAESPGRARLVSRAVAREV